MRSRPGIRRRELLAIAAMSPCGFARAAGGMRRDADSGATAGALAELLAVTPRDQVLDAVCTRIRAGLPRQPLLAALYLAGSLHVAPRPHVGYQYHAVLGLRSVGSAARAAGAEDRWLPLLWAVDYFKAAQARAQRADAVALPPITADSVPAATAPEAALPAAFDRWDLATADAAVSQGLRTADWRPDFDALFGYGLRDFHDIGHKVIAVANCQWAWPRLDPECRGPVLRSLVHALLNAHGEADPAGSDAPVARAWRSSRILADAAPAAVTDRAVPVPWILAALRTDDPSQASQAVADALRDGASEAVLRDALLLAAAEILLQAGNFVAMHAVTTAEAIAQGHRVGRDPGTRRLLLIQGAALLAAFRAASLREEDPDRRIDALAPARSAAGGGTVEASFATMTRDRRQAVREILGLRQAAAGAVFEAARRHTRLRTREIHDYKFTEAVIAGYDLVSPPWRDRWLAAGAMWFNTPADPENDAVRRARARLRGVEQPPA